MHCMPIVHVGRPDTVQLSGCTTLKSMKTIYNWTVSGLDICPRNTGHIKSPVFSHPNSSKWSVELEKDGGKPKMAFRLLASKDSRPVCATLKAYILDKNCGKQYVYPPDVHELKVGERSPVLCVTDNIRKKKLVGDWNFEIEVCSVEVVTENLSNTAEDESVLAKDLGSLLDSKQLADITLSAGGIVLGAHKVILCARSPVFRAMLSHDTKEAREGIVGILDVEPEVLAELLRYMYTDSVEIPNGMTEQLLVAFDKYGLQDAKLTCELELARQLTTDRVAEIAVYAILHSCHFLEKMCVAFIKQNLQQVAGTRAWANIIDKYPKVAKAISELVTEGSERCSSPSATTGSQSEGVTESSPALECTPQSCAPEECAGNSDSVCDSGYTRCERKKLVYVWTIYGLTNWPQNRTFVASPRFCHPETVEWKVKLNKFGTEYNVSFQLLQNKAGGKVLVDLSVSVIPPEGEKCRIYTSTDCVFEEGSESEDKIECGYLAGDVLTLECEICMVCIVQQYVGATKPVLQSGLRQDLHSLLESGSFADFKLCAGTVEMRVHRAILVARSPFFARTLQPGSEWLEKGHFDIPDVKPEVLAEVLHYMYTGRVKNLGESTMELLTAADRFELGNLKKECLSHLSSRLTLGNAVTTAVHAIENQCDMLLKLAMGFIRVHFMQVMGTAEWMDAIDKHPAAVKRISQLVAKPEK